MIPKNYTLLAGIDANGIVQCGLVIDMSSEKDIFDMIRHIKKYGYTRHDQNGGTITIGGRIGEDADLLELSAPKQEAFCFA